MTQPSLPHVGVDASNDLFMLHLLIRHLLENVPDIGDAVAKDTANYKRHDYHEYTLGSSDGVDIAVTHCHSSYNTPVKSNDISIEPVVSHDVGLVLSHPGSSHVEGVVLLLTDEVPGATAKVTC